MGLFVAVALAVVLAFLACIAVEKILSWFVKEGAVLFLMVAVIGVLACGVVFSFVVFVFPDVFIEAGCFGNALGAGLPVLFIIFMSYYFCAIDLSFFRFRKDKLGKKRRAGNVKKKKEKKNKYQKPPDGD